MILDYCKTTDILADSLSKMIDGVTFLRHDNIYMGLVDMSEKHGVGTGKKAQQTKAFKINIPNEQRDETRAYMVCIVDFRGDVSV